MADSECAINSWLLSQVEKGFLPAELLPSARKRCHSIVCEFGTYKPHWTPIIILPLRNFHTSNLPIHTEIRHFSDWAACSWRRQEVLSILRYRKISVWNVQKKKMSDRCGVWYMYLTRKEQNCNAVYTRKRYLSNRSDLTCTNLTLAISCFTVCSCDTVIVPRIGGINFTG